MFPEWSHMTCDRYTFAWIWRGSGKREALHTKVTKKQVRDQMLRTSLCRGGQRTQAKLLRSRRHTSEKRGQTSQKLHQTSEKLGHTSQKSGQTSQKFCFKLFHLKSMIFTMFARTRKLLRSSAELLRSSSQLLRSWDRLLRSSGQLLRSYKESLYRFWWDHGVRPTNATAFARLQQGGRPVVP